MVMQQRKPAITRRSFLAGTAGTTLIMGLGAVLPGCSREEAVSDIAKTGSSQIFSPTVWIEIDTSGGVLINIAKAEMGQHVGTALARIVADELGADWNTVSIRHVDSDPKWGYMVTGGSWSVFTSFTMLSQAGAAGRSVLLDAGAKMLGVQKSECIAAGGIVSSGDQSVSFADIVAANGDIRPRRSPTRNSARCRSWRQPIATLAYRRQASRALDVPEPSPEALPSTGSTPNCPAWSTRTRLIPPTRYGSSILSIDDAAAKAVPGYRQTLKINDPSGIIQGWALVIADS